MKITWSSGSLSWGVGLTVIVNVCGVPSQPSKLGVTTILEVIGLLVVFVATTSKLPVPEFDKPIAELLLVQAYVVTPPLFSVLKLIFILSSLQNSWLAGLFTWPNGFTVTDTVNESPTQSSAVDGVIVYVKTAEEIVELINSDSEINVVSIPEVPPVIALTGELTGAFQE